MHKESNYNFEKRKEYKYTTLQSKHVFPISSYLYIIYLSSIFKEGCQSLKKIIHFILWFTDLLMSHVWKFGPGRCQIMFWLECQIRRLISVISMYFCVIRATRCLCTKMCHKLGEHSDESPIFMLNDVKFMFHDLSFGSAVGIRLL